jgi:hypothetical protein
MKAPCYHIAAPKVLTRWRVVKLLENVWSGAVYNFKST